MRLHYAHYLEVSTEQSVECTSGAYTGLYAGHCGDSANTNTYDFASDGHEKVEFSGILHFTSW